MRAALLILTTLISLYYCLRFGYIWTAYGHGGQILGIPFAILNLILVISYFLTKNKNRKSNLFIITIIYFLTLAGFSITIELIRSTKENYFQFLYYEPGGWVNKILLAWLIFGIVVLIVTLSVKSELKAAKKLDT